MPTSSERAGVLPPTRYGGETRPHITALCGCGLSPCASPERAAWPIQQSYPPIVCRGVDAPPRESNGRWPRCRASTACILGLLAAGILVYASSRLTTHVTTSAACLRRDRPSSGPAYTYSDPRLPDERRAPRRSPRSWAALPCRPDLRMPNSASASGSQKGRRTSGPPATASLYQWNDGDRPLLGAPARWYRPLGRVLGAAVLLWTQRHLAPGRRRSPSSQCVLQPRRKAGSAAGRAATTGPRRHAVQLPQSACGVPVAATQPTSPALRVLPAGLGHRGQAFASELPAFVLAPTLSVLAAVVALSPETLTALLAAALLR